jgi:hypothetical protein
MVITRANPTSETEGGLDAQGNAGDHLMSSMPPNADLAQRVEQLTSLVERMLDRDVTRSRQEDQVVQTATALTQMTEAVTRLTRVAARREPDRPDQGDEDDDEEELDDPELPVAAIVAADPRFQALFNLDTYRLTNRRSKVTARGVSQLTKRAGELRPRMTKSFTGRDGLEIIPFLTRLREVSEEAGLSEGVLLRLLPDLLAEPALTAFRSTHPSSYPVALRWLLLTYAPEAQVSEYWRRLQQSRQTESESPAEFALRIQMEAAKMGTLISPQELKALFESGLIDATRHLLRATLIPDPNRTLTDSVSTAEALAKALSAQKLEYTFRTDAARLRARKALIAEPVREEEDGWLEWRTPPDDEVEDLLACYWDRDTRGAIGRRDNQGTRLCWTCWLPGHFSEECPVVPEHLRPEIAARKQKALTELRRQRSERSQSRQPGWYRPRAEPPAARDLPSSPLTTTEPTPTLLAKNEDGGEPRSH